MRHKLTFEGVFERGAPDLPYRYVPFELPPGTRRLEVSYEFERPYEAPPGTPADVVDIGVFDSRGADFLTGGFRGWSGSARRTFFIQRDAATPGYLRGPLLRGEWQLFLGCRINHAERCRYWVHVSLDINPDAAEEAATPVSETSSATRAPAPRSGEGRWYRGDFHSHTEHSDGLNTVDEYAREARRLGLDFLAITDHNTTAHFADIAARKRELLLVPGEEVTTPWGHANVWGAGGWVDFRCTNDDAMQQVLDDVHARGGLFSPNHPKVSAGYPWLFPKVRGYRVIEAWQGAWRYFNTESVKLWEERLRAGERVVAVGGSDAHSIPPAVPQQPWTLGNPCTWVYVRGPLDEEGVLDAVRAGHVFVSEDPTGPFLEMTASCNGETYLMGDEVSAPEGTPVTLRFRYRGPAEKKLRLLRDGRIWREVAIEGEKWASEVELPLDGPSYVRAEVAGFRGRPERGEVVHVLTNPVYLLPEVR